MWAKTLCPLSSSTRNCVLGNASVMVPSTSMTSSLAKDLPTLTSYKMTGAKQIYYHAHYTSPTPEPPHWDRELPARHTRSHLSRLGQDPRPILRNGDGVLV